jgi:hypothetical protein
MMPVGFGAGKRGVTQCFFDKNKFEIPKSVSNACFFPGVIIWWMK